MSIVFVIDAEGTPLLPTHPARARKLLRAGRAVVKRVVPFTIQLKRKVDNPVGSFEMGVDDGAKHVGIAVKNTKTDEIVFRAQADHRQDVTNKVTERRCFRNRRRQRLKYRAIRYKNRTGRNRIVPTQKQRKEVVLRIAKDLRKLLNIVTVRVEELKCSAFKMKTRKYFCWTAVGKNYLSDELCNAGFQYETTFGYITQAKRIELGLSKTHSNDACAIVESNKVMDREYYIKPRRTRLQIHNVAKTCVEKNGFRHFDVIKSTNKNKGTIIGSICSLNKDCISVRTKDEYGMHVRYSKSKLLQRSDGLVYTY